ncbi:nucleic acid-binding protein [Punctularia strigosozonata HHB-11173 SS5]|uniref:nucleic acid-binding protein n=1 Tax=Punctularia strigosozonata (strain HHB-11173) TaxID=741275 RepID=UPI00044177A7|nr:nucleic acid-binding protein [Punctularia strigosozonata HHB-11173 SS5]EIN12893.1 nucleic acid-binding protein [Punctularia strigosozonata HHB-11173 SS5]
MPPMSFVGQVTKVGCMNKTATVTVSRWVVHPRTRKRIERSKKYHAHDEHNQCRLEDTVLIRNCRPISKLKAFAVEKILRSPEREHEAMIAERLRKDEKAKEAEERMRQAALNIGSGQAQEAGILRELS